MFLVQFILYLIAIVWKVICKCWTFNIFLMYSLYLTLKLTFLSSLGLLLFLKTQNGVIVNMYNFILGTFYYLQYSFDNST
jgi:hypothetical protein